MAKVYENTVYVPVEGGDEGNSFPLLDLDELRELQKGGDSYVASLPTQ